MEDLAFASRKIEMVPDKKNLLCLEEEGWGGGRGKGLDGLLLLDAFVG
jgi:hypothetical protein